MPDSAMVYHPERGQQIRECVIIDQRPRSSPLAGGWSDEIEQGGCCTPRWKHPSRLDTGTVTLWGVLIFIPHGADRMWIHWEPFKLKLYGLVKSSSDQKPIITNAVAKPPNPYLHSKGKLSQSPSLALASEESLRSMTDCLNGFRLCDTMFVLWGCAILFTQWITNRFSLF